MMREACGSAMKARIVDEAISQAWLEAAKDLGIRVTGPFTVQTGGGKVVTYEAYVPDFGGPKGSVTGVLNDKLRDCRATQDYYCSNLSPSYRRYNRQLFIDTLNDWGWFGPTALRPAWYTGKPWS
jgi:hypothetical protein